MPECGPKTVLVVDDEDLFLRTIVDGFASSADRVNILTAPNGRYAAEILQRCSVDLVVTDLQMPEMDGFGLIALMSRICPEVPIIVMTAFGTPDTEGRLEGHGVFHHLDKPLDFQTLSERVFEALSASASGHLQGIALPTLLQMVEADRKTCTLCVKSNGTSGVLYFLKGTLVDAEAGSLQADEAALSLVCWEHPEIEILGGRVQRTRRIKMSLAEVLLEGFRQKDEQERSAKKAGGAWSAQASPKGEVGLVESIEREVEAMAAIDKLKELSGIEGFAGAAVFSPTGEQLAVLAGEMQHLKEVGILANNVLLNSQKASLEMGTGRGQQVHIEAEKAHIMVRCLNEGTDPLKSQPGKAHIHVVLILKDDASLGLAKMRLNSVTAKLADEFRM
jgi:CheY-like chemotaxis protein/predicted regulator of Ras-like GTPase activity (Roadblock/LC7/MglB family)